MHLPVVTVAAVGIDPERAFLLSRGAGRAAVELGSALAQLRADLAGECTGVPALLGSTVQWLQSASGDVARRATVAANDSMLGFIGPLHPSSFALYDDALLGLVTAGNALGVRLLLDGLSEEQLMAMASKVLGLLSAAELSDDEREAYRRALLPLAAALLALATAPAAVVYAGGGDSDASSRLARLTATVERLMLLPPNREGSCWGAFFRGLFFGDWDRGYTTPGLESARVTGLFLSGLIPGVDLRDVAAAVRNRDVVSGLLGTLALVPVYGDLLRIGSRGAGTVLRLNRVGRRLGQLSKKADALAVSAGPVPAVAAGLARGRTVAGGIRNVTGGASGVGAVLAGPAAGGAVGLRDLPRDVRRGLQQVALGRVQGSPVERGEIGSLPKKDGGHFTRYSLGADVVAVTGADAELYVSRDGGCTWFAVAL